MKRILIALESDFTNNVFKNNFTEEGLDVIATTTNGVEALAIINQILPDVALIDTNLYQLNGFEVLNAVRNNENTKRMPIIIYSKSGSEQHYNMALDYEANDFVIGLSDSPRDVVTKIKTHLGEQKVYMFDVSSDENTARELAHDIGYGGDLRCPQCSSNFQLHLLRNLNLGKNTFKVSFVCGACSYRIGGGV